MSGHRVCIKSGTVETRLRSENHAAALVSAGAAEILLNSIDNDGQMKRFDLPSIQRVARRVAVPVVACGGAGNVEHLRQAVSAGGASAVATGNMFVFHGRHRAALIDYLSGSGLRSVAGQ